MILTMQIGLRVDIGL